MEEFNIIYGWDEFIGMYCKYNEMLCDKQIQLPTDYLNINTQ